MADRGAAYPNPLDGSGEWYHGTQAHPEDLEHGFQDPMNSGEWNAWNATLGTHFTADHNLARKFAEGEHHLGGGDEDYDDWGDPADEPNPSVVHARLHLRNPKVYDSEHDLDHEAYEHEWAAGNHPSKDFPDDEDERAWDEEHERPGMYEVHREFGDSKIPRDAYSPMGTRNAGHPVRQIWLTTHPDMHGIARRFRDRLEAQGHDGIVYGNEWERGAHGRSAPSVIAFHPHQIEITQHHGEAEEHPGHPVVAHFDDDAEELDDPERGNWDDEHGLYHHPENGWHCPTCQDFHDDAETVNGHQTAYTDWDRVHPGLPEHMHRGFAVALPRELHDAVHDESRPAADRARMLLDHLGSEGHGTHWTPDEAQAGHYAGVSAHQNSGSWNGASGQTHIVLHARRPELEHIETDPDTLASQDVIGFGEHDDAEIPLRQGAPVHLTGVSWRHESEPWTRHELPAATEHTAALDGGNGLSWDEIGERHPAIYGDPEVHGEEADGSDGPGIGEAASHLAFSRPEDPDAEGHSVHDLTFHQRTVDPARIDYQRNERFDPRVQRARQGFRGQLPGEHVPPLVLVHRHGVFQVADGHHRAEGAALEHRPVRAYVAYSPYEHEPFGDGERGPYHGAETEERPPLTDAMSGRTTRLAYEGWPHTAEVPAPHMAALVAHFAEGDESATVAPAFHGTRYAFAPGQILTTEAAPRVNQGFGNGVPDGIYYSGYASVAGSFAENATGPDWNPDARPRVYLIRPVAAVETDPDEEPQFDSHRTQRAAVIGEVPWSDAWFDGDGNPVLDDQMRHVAALVDHSAEPRCRYCDEPMDEPEDIDNGSHDECDEMRWCEACQEHHDDPQVTEDHNSTYTDWGGHVFDDGIHRGVTVRLPDDVHAIVHDSSRPSEERAGALASYLHANPIDDDYSHGRAAGYGLHWTDHLPTAQAWGSGEGAMFGINDSERRDPRWTHVVMHAATPDDDDFETDPEELSRRNMLGYDHARSEREIPLTAAAPVHLTALSWKPAGSPADGWERHALPPEHHAATASLVEHFETSPHPRTDAEMRTHLSEDHRLNDDELGGNLWDLHHDEHHGGWDNPDHQHERFYHGTSLGFENDEDAPEHITPQGGAHLYPGEHTGEHAFATTSPSSAWDYAEKAWHAGRGVQPRVLEVRPTGPFEQDPDYHENGQSRSVGEGALRSHSPWAVIGEEPIPEHLQQHDPYNDEWEHDASLDASESDEHDGDGYTTCDQGHEHWGLNGAAGLLIRHQGDDGQTRYLLQHRSPHVQHGNTWSTPGGAMGSSETPEHAALREATEEMGALPGNLTHHHTHTDDHGGWSYSTVVMDSPRMFVPSGHGDTQWETSGHGWYTPDEIRKLPLHPGFAATWDRVRHSGALDAGTGLAGPSPSYSLHTASGTPLENHYDATMSPGAIPLPASSNADGPLHSHDRTGGTQDYPHRSMHTGDRNIPGTGPGPGRSGSGVSAGLSPDSLPASPLPAAPHTADSGRSGTHTSFRPSSALSSGAGTDLPGESGHSQHTSFSARNDSTWRSHTAATTWYHGTSVVLHPGDHVRPGAEMGLTSPYSALGEPGEVETHTHATSDLGNAADYAQAHMVSSGGRRPRVYAVTPLNAIEDDPGDNQSVRSRGLMRVDHEVPESEWRPAHDEYLDTVTESRADLARERLESEAALQAVAAVPSFTWNYQTYGPQGGYIDQSREVTGPFYHGGRSKRLGEGDQLTSGRKTNDWGDEGPKSKYVHFTTDLGGAAEYARQAGGHVYEVEPTGEVNQGYSGSEWKSKAPLRVRRVVPPAEIEHHAHTGKLVVAANVADRAPARVIAPALPAGTTARNTLGDWMPQNAAETHDMLDGFPVLFTAIYDGLMGVVAKLEDSPVSGEITGIVRTMATACQTAAEDATEIAARPLDGPEGMWEGSLAGKA